MKIVEVLEYSLSTKEDVLDFLDDLEYVYMSLYGHNNSSEMNLHYLSVYESFVFLLSNLKDNQCLKTIHDLSIGNIKNTDTNKTIKEIASERLGLDENDFNIKLESEINELVELRKQEWLNFIRNKYGKTSLKESFKKKNSQNIKIQKITPVNKLDNYTSPKPKVNKPTPEQLKEKERDLRPLYEFERLIDRKMRRLENLGEKESKVYKTLLKVKIQVRKDINYVRRYYGEVIGNQNRRGRTKPLPLHEVKITNKEMLETNRADTDYISDSVKIQVRLIDQVAKEVLTHRQYIMFKLYYFDELTHQKIAELMQIPRQNVSRDLGTSLEKIRKILL